MLQDRKIDKSIPVPMYYQLKTILLDEINDGTFKPGDIIPTEDELCNMFEISRTTVRQAIQELVAAGTVYRVKSKGTFVSEPKIERRLPQDNSYYNSHAMEEDVQKTGKTARTEIQEFKVIPVPPPLIPLGYHTDSGKVLCLCRVQYADDVPFCRNTIYMNYDKFEYLLHNRDLYEKSMGEILSSREDTTVCRIVRTLEAQNAGKEEVEVLKIKSHSAVMKITSTRYNRKDEFIDHSIVYYRGDYCKFDIETRLDPHNEAAKES